MSTCYYLFIRGLCFPHWTLHTEQRNQNKSLVEATLQAVCLTVGISAFLPAMRVDSLKYPHVHSLLVSFSAFPKN